MAITHKYTLICDDVRQENNGKFIVIGLYTGGITVPQIPFGFPFLTFFVCVEADTPGTFSIRLRLESLEQGRRLIEGMGALTVQRPGIAATPIKMGPVQLQATGAYNFVAQIEGQAEIVTSFEVILQQTGQQPIRR